MSSAASKSLLFVFPIAAALLAAASCHSGPTQRQLDAQALGEQARAALQQGQYARAIELMDSVDSAFTDVVDVRRELLALRPEAMEGLTIQQIQQADTALAQLQKTLAQLEPSFQTVHDPALLEDYRVPRQGRVAGLMTTTGVEPRLSADGHEMYVVASLQGRNIGLRALRLAIGPAKAATADIPAGDERAIAIPSGQKAVFSGQDVEPIGQLASGSRGNAGVLTMAGRNGSRDVNLSAAQVNALADAYDYSQARAALDHALMERERLERQLAIARNQKAQRQGQ